MECNRESITQSSDTNKGIIQKARGTTDKVSRSKELSGFGKREQREVRG